MTMNVNPPQSIPTPANPPQVTQTPDNPSQNWWQRNWDKVLPYLTTMILSAGMGFITSLFAIKGDVNQINIKLSALETVADREFRPRLEKLESLTLQIQSLYNDVDQLKRENNIAIQVNKNIDLLIKQIELKLRR